MLDIGYQVMRMVTPYHSMHLSPYPWLADEDSLTCCIVMMGKQIAKMFFTISLEGSLLLMLSL